MRELYRWSGQWWPGAIALVILWAFAAWTSTEPLEGDLAARSNAAVRDAVLDKKRVSVAGRAGWSSSDMIAAADSADTEGWQIATICARGPSWSRKSIRC